MRNDANLDVWIYSYHTLSELITGGAWQWNDYLMVGGSMVGLRILRSDGSISFRYFHQDHLGSIAVITDENGNVVERDGYDAWGRRRAANGTDDPIPTDSITSLTSRGFTGQEMIDSIAVVHLNGRVYDPYLGRMLSPDPVVGDPLNGQTWNRYSYVYNNPLAYTDPTGYCPICLGEALSRIGNGIGKFLQRNPLVGQALVIASAALCAGIAATTANFVVTGLSTGRLDLALQAAAVSAATATADFGIGSTAAGMPGLDGVPSFLQPGALFKDAAHALVGCARFVISGGSCGAGALSGAVPAIAGSLPLYGSLDWTGRLLFKSVLGGLASVAGGGKFANGAVTGAFQYLFNDALHGDPRHYDPSDPNYHHFDFTESLCSFGEDGCTVPAAKDALLLFAGPGQDVPAFAGHTLTAQDPIWTGLSAGPIIQSVSADGLSVTNATLPGHMFDAGYITRSLVITDDGISIRTVGEGTGADPELNAILGPAAFQWLNREMSSYLTGRTGPSLFNGY